MYIIRMILNLVCELPLLNSINKIGGTVGGILKGILIICILLAIINFMAPMGIVTVAVEYINASMITKLLYNANIISMLIKGNLKF